LALFLTLLKFEPPTFENAARYIPTLEQISCVGMVTRCPRQVWWSWVYASRRTVCQSCPHP